MKTRRNTKPVIGALRRKHGLLAAFLEAGEKIDWQALERRLSIAATHKLVRIEEQQAPAESPQLPEVVQPKSPFVFRRANLVQVFRT
jgi:hypothetical protein